MPWRIASGYLAKMRRLLPLDTSHSGCDGRLNSYVRDQLIDPFLAQGPSGASPDFSCLVNNTLYDCMGSQQLRPLLCVDHSLLGLFGVECLNSYMRD